MKTRLFCLLIVLLNIFQSCARTSNDVWEDTKSAGRHVKRGVRAIGGKHGDSRQIRSRNEFGFIEDENYYPEGDVQNYDDQEELPPGYSSTPATDFIPIQDPTNELGSSGRYAPSRETPGEAGSSLPGIQAFRDPSTIPQLAGIFRPVYFEYDSSMIKGQQNLQTVHNIADFLRYNANVYIFIEGHTDERGPQKYNYALGSDRANGVRTLLINEGVNPDQLFTISYGKDRPVVLERHEEGWAKNRRAEFKIYER